MEFLESIQYWHWLVFGFVLIILEVFVPSAILLWPGIAGVAVGVFAYFFPSVAAAVLLLMWAFVSVSLAAGWQIYKKKHKLDVPTGTMNRRGEQYVGRHFTLTKDVINGVGELNVDDTRWKIVSAKDLSAGTKVQVTAVEGTSLRVEEFIS